MAPAAVAMVLFAINGGFGGGHGSFDLAIFVLGLPGVFGALVLPTVASDFLTFVVVPAAINTGLWFAAAHLFFARRRNRGV